MHIAGVFAHRMLTGLSRFEWLRSRAPGPQAILSSFQHWRAQVHSNIIWFAPAPRAMIVVYGRRAIRHYFKKHIECFAVCSLHTASLP